MASEANRRSAAPNCSANMRHSQRGMIASVTRPPTLDAKRCCAPPDQCDHAAPALEEQARQRFHEMSKERTRRILCLRNPSLHSASDGPHIVAALCCGVSLPRRFHVPAGRLVSAPVLLTQEEVRPGVAEDRATISGAILMRRCGRLSLCVSRSVRRRRAGGVRAVDWCLGAVREEWLDYSLAV